MRKRRHEKPHYPTTSLCNGPNLDTAFNPSSPPQFTKDTHSTVLQDRTRPISKYLRHCSENHTGYHLRSRFKIKKKFRIFPRTPAHSKRDYPYLPRSWARLFLLLSATALYIPINMIKQDIKIRLKKTKIRLAMQWI